MDYFTLAIFFVVASPALPFIRCSSWAVNSNVHSANNSCLGLISARHSHLSADVKRQESPSFEDSDVSWCGVLAKCVGSSGECVVCAVCRGARVTIHVEAPSLAVQCLPWSRSASLTE